MPKLKTNRGAAKRFKVRGNGKKIKHRRGFRNHILTKKGKKMKRQARAMGEVDGRDQRSIERLLRVK